ncbi:MAG TPA: hypothetical protein VMR14_17290 [Streptosporangiaceae bacterium]|jgi:uncharacterized protein YbjQ (UPF0145 family)|nr:hypothetical protein [Streptosporangiaceae bacterium]
MAGERADVTAGLDGSGAERPRGARSWGSLLSAQDMAAITCVGFRPVGPVLATAVVHLGYVSRGGKCSVNGSYATGTNLASAESGPFNLLLRKRFGVRQRLLSKAIEKCRELDADGIVGMTLSIKPFPAGGTEFSVQGTAVRARTETRPATPFTSHLSAPEFTRLLGGGWIPTALVFGIALGARHDDQRARNQTSRTANAEVRSYSELVKDTRRDARDQLAKAVAGQGADGVVVSELALHISERECPTKEGTHDHVAEATILGTAIAAFAWSPRASDQPPLTILHLNPSAAAAAGLHPDTAQPPPGRPDSESSIADRLTSAWAAASAARSPVSSSDSAGITKRAE